VRLDPPPHVRDRALRGHAKDLRESERRHRLHQGRRPGRQRQRDEQFRLPLPDHVVDEVFG
jgi:hypothetical protein